MCFRDGASLYKILGEAETLQEELGVYVCEAQNYIPQAKMVQHILKQLREGLRQGKSEVWAQMIFDLFQEADELVCRLDQVEKELKEERAGLGRADRMEEMDERFKERARAEDDGVNYEKQSSSPKCSLCGYEAEDFPGEAWYHLYMDYHSSIVERKATKMVLNNEEGLLLCIPCRDSIAEQFAVEIDQE